MKKIIAIALILVLAVLAISCGSKSDSIVGKWEQEDNTQMPLEGVKVYTIFKEDGTLELELNTEEASDETKEQLKMFNPEEMFKGATYEVKGDELTVTVLGQTETNKFELKGDTLKTFDDKGEVAATFKRVK